MGHLPPKHSFLEVQPANLILSAFKKAEDRDSYILRVFNPTQAVVEGKINLAIPIKKVYLTNLNEERQTELAVKDLSTISLKVASNKIITLEIEA